MNEIESQGCDLRFQRVTFVIVNMTPAQQVAANVRSEAARQMISQTQLARAIGMSQQMLSQRMLGRVAFNVNELTAVAEFLRVPVEHLHCTTAVA